MVIIILYSRNLICQWKVQKICTETFWKSGLRACNIDGCRPWPLFGRLSRRPSATPILPALPSLTPVRCRPDHGPPDPINPIQVVQKNPTRPNDGLDTGRNIWSETQKKSDPIRKLHAKLWANPTRPDYIMGRVRVNIFLPRIRSDPTDE